MKIIDKVIFKLHVFLCPNKKVVTKILMISLTFSGKNSKILLTALAISVTNLEGLNMRIQSLEDPIFGIRCIHFHLSKCLALLSVGLHLSFLVLIQRKGLSKVKMIKDGKCSNFGGKYLEKRAIFSHQTSWVMQIFSDLIVARTLIMMFLEMNIYSGLEMLKKNSTLQTFLIFL